MQVEGVCRVKELLLCVLTSDTVRREGVMGKFAYILLSSGRWKARGLHYKL